MAMTLSEVTSGIGGGVGIAKQVNCWSEAAGEEAAFTHGFDGIPLVIPLPGRTAASAAAINSWYAVAGATVVTFGSGMQTPDPTETGFQLVYHTLLLPTAS
jgi:hypothetical protein